MVAIKTSAADQFIKSPDNNISAFLIYGPDQGLVFERSQFIAKNLQEKFDGAELLNIGENDYANNSSVLFEEVNSMAMFSPHKIIITQQNQRLKIDQIKSLLSENLSDTHLILKAGDLKKSSALRKLFEGQKHLAAIACYADTSRTIYSLINEVLSGHNLTIDKQASNLLASRLGSDRTLSRNELEKLALYCANKAQVTIDDVNAIIIDNSALESGNLIAQILSGKAKDALHSFQRLLSEGQTAPTLLIRFNFHLERLLKGAIELDQGKGIEQVLSSQKPPLYFDRKEQFKDQLRRWPLSKIQNLYFKSVSILNETRIKNNKDLEQIEIERLFLSAASQAAHRR